MNFIGLKHKEFKNYENNFDQLDDTQKENVTNVNRHQIVPSFPPNLSSRTRSVYWFVTFLPSKLCCSSADTQLVVASIEPNRRPGQSPKRLLTELEEALALRSLRLSFIPQKSQTDDNTQKIKVQVICSVEFTNKVIPYSWVCFTFRQTLDGTLNDRWYNIAQWVGMIS